MVVVVTLIAILVSWNFFQIWWGYRAVVSELASAETEGVPILLETYLPVIYWKFNAATVRRLESDELK